MLGTGRVRGHVVQVFRKRCYEGAHPWQCNSIQGLLEGHGGTTPCCRSKSACSCCSCWCRARQANSLSVLRSAIGGWERKSKSFIRVTICVLVPLALGIQHVGCGTSSAWSRRRSLRSTRNVALCSTSYLVACAASCQDTARRPASLRATGSASVLSSEQQAMSEGCLSICASWNIISFLHNCPELVVERAHTSQRP